MNGDKVKDVFLFNQVIHKTGNSIGSVIHKIDDKFSCEFSGCRVSGHADKNCQVIFSTKFVKDFFNGRIFLQNKITKKKSKETKKNVALVFSLFFFLNFPKLNSLKKPPNLPVGPPAP